ncbi:hypothetical protein CAEBREN_31248 [Caenorhabditis brenneri]|uniref:7TM GPCR serpentine receptor class x (Srx) domain-containing protein n=1 Tax=Caenorhabditis brenneri TaxID=135651 RepID=G0N8N9_CAEBE|nr:hypothetical protein CAEBREN_31248 [Caenorhabditis brenneri]
MFEDKICNAQMGKHILLSIRDYFQMVIVQSHLTFTIERLISIKSPEIHKHPSFKTYFYHILFFEQVFAFFYSYTNNFHTETFGIFWLCVFHFIIIVNWPIVFYTKKQCRKLYKADVQTYDLKRKHELYKSYEITKSLVTAIVVNAIQQFITFLFVGLQLGGLLFPMADYYKTLFILHMIWNSNFVVYTWVLLLSHRSSRRKILAIQPKISITSIDGTDITLKPNQREHFQELKVAWS